MCEKQHFKDVMGLAKLSAWLAEQAQNLEGITPDCFTEAVLVWIKSLKGQVKQLALDIGKLAVRQKSTAISFSDVVATNTLTGAAATKTKPGVKGKMPAPRAPCLTLSQLSAEKADNVEL